MIRRTIRSLARRLVAGAPKIPAEKASARERPTRGSVPPPQPEAEDEDGSEVEVSPAQARTWMEDPARRPLLVDIREEHEVLGGHAQGALLLPMNQVPHRLAELPRDRDLLVYCAAGARSFGVAHFLREQGFPLAWSLSEGFGAWIDTGAPWVPAPTDAPLRPLRPVRLRPEAAEARGLVATAGSVQEVRRDADGAWRFAVSVPQPDGPALRIEGLREGDLEPIGRGRS